MQTPRVGRNDGKRGPSWRQRASRSAPRESSFRTSFAVRAVGSNVPTRKRYSEFRRRTSMGVRGSSDGRTDRQCAATKRGLRCDDCPEVWMIANPLSTRSPARSFVALAATGARPFASTTARGERPSVDDTARRSACQLFDRRASARCAAQSACGARARRRSLLRDPTNSDAEATSLQAPIPSAACPQSRASKQPA
jgi:hypothetical protein